MWPLTIQKPPAVSPGKKHSKAKRAVSRTARRQHDAHKRWERDWGEYNGQWAIKHLTLYYGTADQLPNNEITQQEGNAISAFRELAYIVVKGEELTDSAGVIPNFEFCVIASPPEVYVTSRPFPLRETDQLHLNAQPQGIQLRRIYQEANNKDTAALSYQPQSITLKQILLSHENYHDQAGLSYSVTGITLT